MTPKFKVGDIVAYISFPTLIFEIDYKATISTGSYNIVWVRNILSKTEYALGMLSAPYIFAEDSLTLKEP